ncbi:MAG: DUF1727 domain-containing protein, partial [Chloroflexi bacterium]|nr:DUF1727 domain-containing protein [Chloroflexota bacterium]
AARGLGRGGGTALPGLVASAIAPDLLESVLAQLGHGVLSVTGTNGKTTTTHLLAAIARVGGLRPLTNRSGSNLERGLVSACIDATDGRGRLARPADRVGLLEVDEAAWPVLLPRMGPRVAVFLNLFRDQLDRYGEVDSVAEGWRRALAAHASPLTLVLNADDPAVAQLAAVAPERVLAFGVDDAAVALPGAEHAKDVRFCSCGVAFAYDAIYMGHVGRWRCPGCGRARPALDVCARRVELDAEHTRFELHVQGRVVHVQSPLAGLYSVYDALAAAAGALALGLPLEAVGRALDEAGPAFGRQERFTLPRCSARLLLAKNPTGLNEVVRTLAATAEPVTLLLLLNDDIQDGRDVSWIYDADVERLRGRVGALVIGGTRADDMALRCALAGLEPTAVVGATVGALDEALARTPEGGRLDIVATYTAMLSVRAELAHRAHARAYWEERP